MPEGGDNFGLINPFLDSSVLRPKRRHTLLRYQPLALNVVRNNVSRSESVIGLARA